MNTKCLGFILFYPEFINERGKKSGGDFFSPTSVFNDAEC